MKKILVPIDGSQYSDLAIEKAKKIAEAFGSDVVLLHVNDFYNHMFNYNMTAIDQTFISQFKQMSQDILNGGKSKFEGMKDRVETVSLEGNVANQIIDYANDNDFDLIIVGSHGKGRSKGFLVGSVAQKVAGHVKKSVMIAK